MQEEKGTRPIVGHHAGWGLTAGQNRIEPYKLTPGSTDTMVVRVREKIDIHGVGTDVVVMEGIFTVRRDHACAVGGASEAKWGESCLKTEFRALELSGTSQVFGTVRVHLDPTQSSNGMVGPAESGSLAASCVAHCFPVVELPDLGMKLTTNGQPVSLASKVIQIPPVGDVARSDNSAALVDDAGNTLGEIVSSDIEVGQVLYSAPLGSTGAWQTPHEHVHTADSHEEPSGPQFYANPPTHAATTQDAPQIAVHTHEMPATGSGGGISKSQVESTLKRIEGELHTLIRAIREAGRPNEGRRS